MNRLQHGCWWLAVLVVACHAAELRVGSDDQGLHSLKVADDEFLADGALHVRKVVFRRWDGSTHTAEARKPERSFDAPSHTARLRFPWGEVSCRYQPEAERLGMRVTVRNATDEVLDRIFIQLMETRFPQPPQGWKPHYPRRAFNLGAPTTLFAVCEKTALVACNEDVERPLHFGWAGRKSLERRPLIVATGSDWMQHLLDPMLHRPILPGQSDGYDLSLRFTPAATPASEVVGDLWRRFAQAHPYGLQWEDRRPIGALFLSSSNLKAPLNPRGWFNDRKADFMSERGRTDFRRRLIEYARRSLEVLKDMNCQGMVTWDIEGQEYPHAISYLGDPRSLPPEMEPAADDYFRVFTEAGLRVGVCVRPQLPVRSPYGDRVRQTAAADVESLLDAKISYAKKRWGCTLFYIDSNGDPNVPMDANIFRRLAAKHADCLLMPEHENTLYYSATAPYRDYANLKQLGTSDRVRAVYPSAFCALYIGHRDPAPVEQQLVEAVRRGDILVIHGWYRPKSHAVIERVYAAAAKR